MAYISMSMVPRFSFSLLHHLPTPTVVLGNSGSLHTSEVASLVQHDAQRKDGLCPLVIAVTGSGFLFGDFVVGHLGVLQMSTPKMEIWLAD